MSTSRVAAGPPGLAVALALVAVVATVPAAAQVVSTFDQARSTNARANDANRDNSVVGFGTWSSDIRVEAPGTAGTATQVSGIEGDSTLASGTAAGTADHVGDVAEGRSDFSVYFLLTTQTGYTLVGEVTTGGAAAVAAAGEAGAASARIVLVGPSGGAIAAQHRDCAVGSGQPEKCLESGSLVASGVLAPGVYHLTAHASAMAVGGLDAAAGEAQARFTLRIAFDGPVVSVRPSTWGEFKLLYR